MQLGGEVVDPLLNPVTTEPTVDSLQITRDLIAKLPKDKKGKPKIINTTDVNSPDIKAIQPVSKAIGNYIVPTLKSGQTALNAAFQQYKTKYPDATELPHDEAVKAFPDYQKWIEHANVYNDYRARTTLPERRGKQGYGIQGILPSANVAGNESEGLIFGPTTPYGPELQNLFKAYEQPQGRKDGGKIGSGLKKKIQYKDAGGSIIKDDSVKDPNYRKYKNDVGSIVGDVGLSVVDWGLQGMGLQDVIKEEDYATRFGSGSNRLNSGVGAVANVAGGAVLDYFVPGLGSGINSLKGTAGNAVGKDKGISDSDYETIDSINKAGQAIGSVTSMIGGKKGSGGSSTMDTVNTVVDTATNAIPDTTTTATTPQSNTQSGPMDFSTYDTSKFTADQQTAWAGAKTNSDKATLLKSWGLKHGGLVGKYAKGGPINQDSAFAAKTRIKYDGNKAYIRGEFEDILNEKDPEKRESRMKGFNAAEQELSRKKNLIKNAYPFQKKAEGGKIVGPGNGKSDSIVAEPEDGSFVVPVENAKIAEELREKYLGGDKKQIATLRKKGDPNAAFRLSNGEHLFSKKEVDILKSKGVDLNALAPNAEDKTTAKAEGGGVEAAKKAKAAREKANADAVSAVKDADKKRKAEEVLSAIGRFDYDLSKIAEAYEKGLKTFSGMDIDEAYKTLQQGYDKKNQEYKQLTGKDYSSASKPATTPAKPVTTPVSKPVKSGPGLSKKFQSEPAPVFESPIGKYDFEGAEDTPVDNKRQEQVLAASTPKGLESLSRQKQEEASGKTPEATATPSLTAGAKEQPATKGKGRGILGKFDIEEGAALGQLGLGLSSLIREKRPVDTIDSEFAATVADAQKEATFGLSDRERSIADRSIERNRRADVENIVNLSGGSAGTALANIGAATVRADDATNNLSSLSESLRLQKKGLAANLVGKKAEMSRRIFEDNMNAFNQNQVAGANLVGAGIQNLIGSKRFDKEQEAQDKRAMIGASVSPSYTPYTITELDTRFKGLAPDEQKKYGSSKVWADTLGLKYS